MLGIHGNLLPCFAPLQGATGLILGLLGVRVTWTWETEVGWVRHCASLELLKGHCEGLILSQAQSCFFWNSADIELYAFYEISLIIQVKFNNNDLQAKLYINEE